MRTADAGCKFVEAAMITFLQVPVVQTAQCKTMLHGYRNFVQAAQSRQLCAFCSSRQSANNNF